MTYLFLRGNSKLHTEMCWGFRNNAWWQDTKGCNKIYV